MLEQEFERLYYRFRLLHYQTMFEQIEEKESRMSATEAFAAEVIHLLDRPTVKEFADFLHISQPNATYKINSLETKGYIRRIPSSEDRREILLDTTDKFRQYYGRNAPFVRKMIAGMKERYSPAELDRIEALIRQIVDEVLEAPAHRKD